jgi:uncharacterized protein (DUF2141 family)
LKGISQLACKPKEREMKLWHFATTAAALALGFSAMAQAASAPRGCTGPVSKTWLNLGIEQIRSSNGVITLTLYPDDQAKFLAPKGHLYVTRVKARAGTSGACIYLPGPGTYALAIYHDENGNGKLDRNAIGIPQEGFGFSNNPSILMSAPSLKSVRFSAPAAGSSSRIRMKYP